MSIHQVFISSIYHKKLGRVFNDAFNKDLTKVCYQLAAQDDVGHKWSEKNYLGGYTSYSSISNLYDHVSVFTEIKEAIIEHAYEFSKSLQYDIKKSDLRMNAMWMNIMPTQVTHAMHIHPLSFLSGTYYVQTPAKASCIKFEDPRMCHFMIAPPRKKNLKLENKNFIEIEPKAGEIVLFESWMRHEVPPNQSKTERVSVSFNLSWF